MKVDYKFIDQKMEAFGTDWNLKDYCRTNDLNYASVRVGLSRYRKKLPVKILPNRSKKDRTLAERFEDERSAEIKAAFDNRSIKKEKTRIRVPTLNQLREYIVNNPGGHIDMGYFLRHMEKNRALIDRVLNWVRDYNESERSRFT